jgi:hypothetical protein
MSVDEILANLERKGFLFKKPGSNKYAATEVWERWLEFPGLIKDERIQHDMHHQIETARELMKRRGGRDVITVADQLGR